ncbi:hypothetical protein PTKIN_Ptkin14bG0033400 [Pterospermum kingtungense]
MPDFCYFCGCLYHQKNDCDSVISTVKDGVKIERLYSTWLRAESAFFSSPKHVKNRLKPGYDGMRSSLKDGGSSSQESSYPVRPLMAALGGGVQGGGRSNMERLEFRTLPRVLIPKTGHFNLV